VHSVIGFDPATVLPRFINGLPTRFEVASGPVVFNACQIDVERSSGRAVAVERIQRLVEV
jgi:2',3'-cyclic-nucleotide 2'-phosphodiesterase